MELQDGCPISMTSRGNELQNVRTKDVGVGDFSLTFDRMGDS